MPDCAKLGPNQRRALQLLEAHQDGLSHIQLAELLGTPHQDNVRKMMLALARRGLVCVKGWLRSSNKLYAVWLYGGGASARRPKALTNAQASRNYKARKRQQVGDEIWLAVQKARDNGAERVVFGGITVWTKQDSWRV